MILFFRILPVLIGMLCIVTALLPERYREIRNPVITEGEVISIVTQRIYRNHSEIHALAPMVRYQTEHGEIKAASRQFVPDWQFVYKTGDKVRICYEKSQPDKFRICHDNAWQFRRTLCLTVGIGILTAYAVLQIQYH